MKFMRIDIADQQTSCGIDEFIPPKTPKIINNIDDNMVVKHLKEFIGFDPALDRIIHCPRSGAVTGRPVVVDRGNTLRELALQSFVRKEFPIEFYIRRGEVPTDTRPQNFSFPLSPDVVLANSPLEDRSLEAVLLLEK